MTNVATAIVRRRARFRHVSEANRHFAARRLEAPDLLLCPLPRSPTLSVALRSRSADGSSQPVSAARAPCRAFGAVLVDPATLGSGSQARGRRSNPGRSTGPNRSRSRSELQQAWHRSLPTEVLGS